MKKRILSTVLTLAMCLTFVLPVQAAGESVASPRMDAVGAGYMHSGVIDAQGSLWMCGDNIVGQLGNGGLGNFESHGNYFGKCQTFPVKVMDNVASVSCGNQYTAVVKTDGTLWMWGYFQWIGNHGPNKDQFFTPVKVMDNVKTVSCGSTHTAAIKTDGSLWVWGSNDDGEVGNGTVSRRIETPVKIMDNVISVSCGRAYTAAVTADGSLWAWGDYDEYGSGENNYMGRGNTVPVKVMDNVVSVSCDKYADTAVAVKADGTLWVWGYDYKSTSSDDPMVCKAPKKILDKVSTVSMGNGFIAAIKTDGSLWTRGYNTYGQLGTNGAYDHYWSDGWGAGNQIVFKKIMDGVSGVSCGEHHMVIVKSDGSIWTCGGNGCGELGNLEPLPSDSSDYAGSYSDVEMLKWCKKVPTKISLMAY